MSIIRYGIRMAHSRKRSREISKQQKISQTLTICKIRILAIMRIKRLAIMRIKRPAIMRIKKQEISKDPMM